MRGHRHKEHAGGRAAAGAAASAGSHTNNQVGARHRKHANVPDPRATGGWGLLGAAAGVGVCQHLGQRRSVSGDVGGPSTRCALEGVSLEDFRSVFDAQLRLEPRVRGVHLSQLPSPTARRRRADVLEPGAFLAVRGSPWCAASEPHEGAPQSRLGRRRARLGLGARPVDARRGLCTVSAEELHLRAPDAVLFRRERSSVLYDTLVLSRETAALWRQSSRPHDAPRWVECTRVQRRFRARLVDEAHATPVLEDCVGSGEAGEASADHDDLWR